MLQEAALWQGVLSSLISHMLGCDITGVILPLLTYVAGKLTYGGRWTVGSAFLVRRSINTNHNLKTVPPSKECLCLKNGGLCSHGNKLQIFKIMCIFSWQTWSLIKIPPLTNPAVSLLLKEKVCVPSWVGRSPHLLPPFNYLTIELQQPGQLLYGWRYSWIEEKCK